MTDEKRNGRWLAYRSTPYGWERMLMWLLILVCVGVDAGDRLAELPAALWGR